MKAACLTETGTPDVLTYRDLPDPQPDSTEVLVRVGAVAVNPIDTYIRNGAIGMELPSPYIPGCDLAGTIAAVGDKVKQFKVGDRVWGSNQGLFGKQGTFAELAAVDESWLYPTPDSVTDQEAAAIALVGITAYLGLHLNGQLQEGEIVFVNGGTGGVGSMVVQLAKAAGAKVIATAGSEDKLAKCRELGADLALDYHSDSMDDEIREFTQDHGGVDVWFETQRNPTVERTIGLMRKRGRIILMAGREARPEFPLGAFYVNDLRMLGFAMFNATPEEQRVCADDLNNFLADGSLKAQIGKVFPLSEAAAAHEMQENNTLEKEGTLSGKIVLTP